MKKKNNLLSEVPKIQFLNRVGKIKIIIMADFKISGRMSVETLQKQFKDNFGATLRVYSGNKFADPKATLASIRASDAKGGEFSANGHMHVGRFEDEIKRIFGIKVQVANKDNSSLAPNNITLSQSGK